MDFSNWNGKPPVRTEHSVPQHLAQYAIAFAQCTYKLFDEGEQLSQWILGPDYSIWLHWFFVKGNATIHPNTPFSILTLNYMLRNSIPCDLKGFGKVRLEEGKYNLFYVPGGTFNDGELQPGVYTCFHVNFHPTHLIPIAEQYPVFEPMISKAEKGLQNGNQHFASPITRDVTACINSIIECKMGVGERSLFLEARVRDLLRMYVHDQHEQYQLAGMDNQHEKIVLQIEGFMDKHLSEDLSLDTLAKNVNVSRAWLQKLYTRYRGRAVHLVVNEKRMERAKHLLITTDDQVGDIVAAVTIISFQSFSTAFKKYTGETPLEFRRNHRSKQI